MKAIIIISNEERKKLQIINNIKRPGDLKAYFACMLECDPEDIEIRMEELQKSTLCFCIYCKNHIMITDNPKEGKCKTKGGYTTQNALRRVACTDYNAMLDICRSCEHRGKCPYNYQYFRYSDHCFKSKYDWEEEEQKLIEKQTGEKGRIIKEYKKIIQKEV